MSFQSIKRPKWANTGRKKNSNETKYFHFVGKREHIARLLKSAVVKTFRGQRYMETNNCQIATNKYNKINK